MKKILLLFFVLLFCLGIKAQDTILNPEQTYLFQLDSACTPGLRYSGFSQFIEDRTLQYGPAFEIRSRGVRIYGVAVALEHESIPEGKYVFLFKFWGTNNMNISLIDSAAFSYDNCHYVRMPKDGDTTSDTVVRFYHAYFTRPHNIDQYIDQYVNYFFVTYGNSRASPVSCDCSDSSSCSFRISTISNCDNWFPLCDNEFLNCHHHEHSTCYDYHADWGGYPTKHLIGVLPIIDRNLWQPCRPVTGLRSYVYHDRVSFFWDEAYGTCNYELKWGLADDDTSNYQTYYTNSTAAMFYGIEREQEYACLVRSQCLCNDSLWGSEWGPWSDTIHFRRTRFIDAESNNPDWGYVVGGGHYDLWDTVTLEAIPSSSRSTFVSWSDSNTANPRTIIVSQDLTLTAIFAFDSTGLEDSTGIASAAQQRITLVPNPATNSVTITAEAEILSVDAYNVKGQRIATSETHNTTLKLDTSTWPNGTYTITIRTVQGSVSRKLVINK